MKESLTPNQHESLHENFVNPQDFRHSEGGHMAYRRMLFEDDKESYFVKAHDPSLLTDQWRRDEMAYYLEKEARIYRHLETHAYEFAPRLELYDQDMLVLRGLSGEKGWHWRAPEDPRLRQQYKDDVVEAFEALRAIPPPGLREIDEISIDTFYEYGWGKLHNTDAEALVSRNLERWADELSVETVYEAEILLRHLGELAIKLVDACEHVFNHHDARQSNIAWHPEHGVQIVDWSWADDGLPDGDATMFLLDLHKSDHDVADNMHQFNPVYAKMILGYWLQRSQTEHMEGNNVVRMHQFISAIKAGVLLVAHHQSDQ